MLPNGELFGIGARFMHPLMEPESNEIVVRVTVNDGPPMGVPLRKPLGQGAIYRSAPIRLLPPGAQPARAGERLIHAANGDELRAQYERTVTAARVLGTR